MLDHRQRALIRALMYPVQFDSQPADSVSRVMKVVVAAHALQASEEDYLAAINAALESEETLSELLPQQHGEDVIRNYLSQVQNQLMAAPV